MNRFVIKILRVANLLDTKVATVENGEHFTSVDGILYYKRNDTGEIIVVSDPTASTVTSWSDLSGKPTTLAGFGIVDAAPLDHTQDFSTITGKPTTLAGYGIGDGAQKGSLGVGSLAAGTDLNNIATTLNTLVKQAKLRLGTISDNGSAPYADVIEFSTGTDSTTGGVNALYFNKASQQIIHKYAPWGSGWTAKTIAYFADITFTNLAGKPTTLAGYGIVDAATASHTHSFSSLTGKPTTLAGYGITDAATINGPVFLALPSVGADPVAANDLTRKSWVQNQIDTAIAAGLKVIDPVMCASTGSNIALTGLYSLDTYALQVNDRVLVKDQTSSIDNGIYLAAAGAWTRSPDADTSGELNINTYTFVENGYVNASTGWIVRDHVTTIGTDPVIWRQFSASTAYNFISDFDRTGNNITLSNTGVTAGVYTKYQVDVKGRILAAGSLLASDIPVLDWSKITTGTPSTLGGYGITDAQSYSLNLSYIAGLTLAANNVLVTSDTTIVQAPISAYIRDSIFSISNASAFRSALGIQNGNVQVVDISSTGLISHSGVNNIILTVAPSDNGKVFRITNSGSLSSYITNLQADPVLRIVLAPDLVTPVYFPDSFNITIINELTPIGGYSFDVRLEYGYDEVTNTNKRFVTTDSDISNFNYNDWSNTPTLITTNANAGYYYNIAPQEITSFIAKADTSLGSDGANRFFILNKKNYTEYYTSNKRNHVLTRYVNKSLNNLVPDYSDNYTYINPALGGIDLASSGSFMHNAHNDLITTEFRSRFDDVFNIANTPSNPNRVDYISDFATISNVTLNANTDGSYNGAASTTFNASKFVINSSINLSFSRGNKETVQVSPQYGNNYTATPFNTHANQFFYFQRDTRNKTVSLKATYVTPKYLDSRYATMHAWAESNLNDVGINPTQEMALGVKSPFRSKGKLLMLDFTPNAFNKFGMLFPTSSPWQYPEYIVNSCENLDVNTTTTYPGGSTGQNFQNLKLQINAGATNFCSVEPGLFGSMVTAGLANGVVNPLLTCGCNVVADSFFMPFLQINTLDSASDGNVIGATTNAGLSMWVAIDTLALAGGSRQVGLGELNQGIQLAYSTSTGTIPNPPATSGNSLTLHPDLTSTGRPKVYLRLVYHNVVVAKSQSFYMDALKWYNFSVQIKAGNAIKFYVNGAYLGSNVTDSVQSYATLYFDALISLLTNQVQTPVKVWFGGLKTFKFNQCFDSSNAVSNFDAQFTEYSGTTLAQMLFNQAERFTFDKDNYIWKRIGINSGSNADGTINDFVFVGKNAFYTKYPPANTTIFGNVRPPTFYNTRRAVTLSSVCTFVQTGKQTFSVKKLNAVDGTATYAFTNIGGPIKFRVSVKFEGTNSGVKIPIEMLAAYFQLYYFENHDVSGEIIGVLQTAVLPQIFSNQVYTIIFDVERDF
jgi:phage-related tail fiber protein